jgi:hypothetical protein
MYLYLKSGSYEPGPYDCWVHTINLFVVVRYRTHLVCSIKVITVCENGSEITLAMATHVMMIIMVLCTSIEWYKSCWTP